LMRFECARGAFLILFWGRVSLQKDKVLIVILNISINKEFFENILMHII